MTAARFSVCSVFFFSSLKFADGPFAIVAYIRIVRARRPEYNIVVSGSAYIQGIQPQETGRKKKIEKKKSRRTSDNGIHNGRPLPTGEQKIR